MSATLLNIEQLNALSQEKWLLLENPVFERIKVVGGIVLYHSKDKKEDWIDLHTH